MKHILTLSTLLAATALLLACGPAPAQSNPTFQKTFVGGLARTIDYETGVVCYGYVGSGVSCLKLQRPTAETQ